MKNKGPEQWAAVVLREEVERLTVAVRMLEYQQGWFDASATAVGEVEGWRVQLARAGS